MSVGRDGASDAVAFQKAGRPGGRVRPLRRRPPRAGRVGLDRLAGALPARAGRLRAQRARRCSSRRGAPWRAAWRERRRRVPQPGRGVLLRALIAGVLTIALSATAVASTVLLEIDDVVEEFVGPRGGAHGRSTSRRSPRADAGDPRTFLILGSDAALRRQASSRSSRARTRSCSRASTRTRKRIAVMSIPRDLKVDDPRARARARSTRPTRSAARARRSRRSSACSRTRRARTSRSTT